MHVVSGDHIALKQSLPIIYLRDLLVTYVSPSCVATAQPWATLLRMRSVAGLCASSQTKMCIGQIHIEQSAQVIFDLASINVILTSVVSGVLDLLLHVT